MSITHFNHREFRSNVQPCTWLNRIHADLGVSRCRFSNYTPQMSITRHVDKVSITSLWLQGLLHWKMALFWPSSDLRSPISFYLSALMVIQHCFPRVTLTPTGLTVTESSNKFQVFQSFKNFHRTLCAALSTAVSLNIQPYLRKKYNFYIVFQCLNVNEVYLQNENWMDLYKREDKYFI